MSEIISEDDEKRFFPSFVVSDPDPESSSETNARVIGFGKNDFIFTPIVGGHLNFSSTEDDVDFPVNNLVTHIRSLAKTQTIIFKPIKIRCFTTLNKHFSSALGNKHSCTNINNGK